MKTNSVNQILIPGTNKINSDSKLKEGQVSNNSGPSFDKLLSNHLSEKNNSGVADPQHGVQLSTHAAKRLGERNISIDGEEFFKIKEGMDRIRKKGGHNSLILTSNGAYIVDVPNNKIVTAMDKNSIEENVFTKIDSTVIVN